MNVINIGIPEKLFDAIASGTGNSTALALPTLSTQLTWQTSFGSAPASITVQLQTSLDNLNWSTIDTSTSTTGEDRTIATSALFIRARVNAISGGTGITVQLVSKTGFIGLTTPSSVTDGALALFDGTTGSKFKALAFPGGTTTFLRADGTFASAGGGGTPASPSGSLQYNNAGSFGGFGTWDGTRFATAITGGLKLLSGGIPGNYTVNNSGIVMQDSSGNEIWRLWSGDPDAALDPDTANFNAGNVYLGYQAGFSQPTDNTSAAYLNIGIGWQALYSINIGSDNIGLGFQALHLNTDGSNNIAIGEMSLGLNTTGSNNIAIGVQSLVSHTTTPFNTAIGAFSGNTLTTGSNNTYLGYGCGYGVAPDTGSNNTFIGALSQFSNNPLTGSNNTSVGYQSLNIIEGAASNNVAIGANAGAAITSGSNNICIGANVDVSAPTTSNMAVIGNSSITDIYCGSTTPAANVRAAGYYTVADAGIDASITTGSLVGKTITFKKGIITAFA